MNKEISEFIDKFIENNPDWVTFIFLIIFLPFFYKGILYIKNISKEEKEKESTIYANYWGVILGYITLFIMWLIYLSNRLRE